MLAKEIHIPILQNILNYQIIQLLNIRCTLQMNFDKVDQITPKIKIFFLFYRHTVQQDFFMRFHVKSQLRNKRADLFD